MFSKSDNNRGVTLVEMVIAITIAAIIAIIAANYFTGETATTERYVSSTRLRQNVRAAMDLIVREARMIGYNPADYDLPEWIAGYVPEKSTETWFAIINDTLKIIADLDGNKDVDDDDDKIFYWYDDADSIIYRKTENNNNTEIVLEDIAALTFEGKDVNGNPATDWEYVQKIVITMTGRVRVGRPKGEDDGYKKFSMNASVILRNVTAGVDTDPPYVTDYSPANNVTGVTVSDNLELTFNEAVDAESGFIKLYNKTTGDELQSFDVTTTVVVVDGTKVTVDPPCNLGEMINYYVTIDATAFDDISGNSYAGISDDATWNFTSSVEDYSEWSSSLKLGINTTNTGGGADVSGNVSNFPLLVRLTGMDGSGPVFSGAEPDGHDIRFSASDGTHLYYERERWNSGGSAEFWVLVPIVLGNKLGNTDPDGGQYIKMYWGNNCAEDKSQPEKVFDASNNFVGVWHINDDFNNATSNENNGINGGSFDVSPAVIADGQGFDRSNTDDIDVASSSSMNALQYFTGSCWAKMDNNGTSDQVLISFYKSSSDRTYMWFDDPTNGIRCYNVTTGSGDFSATTSYIPADNTWFHVAWVITGSQWLIYVNGVQDGVSAETDDLSDLSDNFYTRFGGRAGEDDRYWGGDMDEIRISRVARSEHWIKLSYETQKTTSTVVSVITE